MYIVFHGDGCSCLNCVCLDILCLSLAVALVLALALVLVSRMALKAASAEGFKAAGSNMFCIEQVQEGGMELKQLETLFQSAQV